MARMTLALLLLTLLAGPGAAQDDGFLEGDKQTLEAPPVRISRPHDAWRFVDLEAVKKKRRDEGLSLDGYGTLKFHLYFGAARTNVYIRAWTNPEKISLQRAAEHHRDGVLETLRDGEVQATKKVRVGKQVGSFFEISGNIPDPKDKTKLMPIKILTATAYRAADQAVITIEMQFAAESDRAKDLAKDFKKLLKKAKF